MNLPYLTPCPKCGVENIDDGLYTCNTCGYIVDTFDEPFITEEEHECANFVAKRMDVS